MCVHGDGKRMDRRDGKGGIHIDDGSFMTATLEREKLLEQMASENEIAVRGIAAGA
jgi:hypothetical protein